MKEMVQQHNIFIGLLTTAGIITGPIQRLRYAILTNGNLY